MRILFQATIALLFALSLLSQQSLQHVRERLVPLDTTEPSASADDLAPLDDFVAGARVVALGEATHGAKEFFGVKHRLVRYLVESHGFTVLAIEDNIPDASRVNRYITTGSGTARGSVSELFGVWNTREFLDLVEWLRLHNSISQEQVMFRGFDIQSAGAAANVALDFLEQVDSDFRRIARELYGPAFEVASDHSTFLSNAPVLLSNSRRVLNHLERRREDYVRSASEDEFEWALANARTVVQLGQTAYDNMPTRDESMAENVLRLLAQDPNARLILWAHNGHVMESRRAGYASVTPMGSVLAEALGDSYLSLGLVHARGRNRAYDSESQQCVTHELPLMPSTVGGQLHRLGERLFFIDLQDVEAKSNATALDEVQPFRWVGWAPGAYVVRAAPATAFDGLLFIDTISPAHGLPLPD